LQASLDFPTLKRFLTFHRLKSLLFLTISALCTTLTAQDFKAYEQNIPGTEIAFKMVPIPAGSFTMGSPNAEMGREEDEGPQRKVQLSPFC
jgi:formylglycine-generating enzyme required for sulfatase activity